MGEHTTTTNTRANSVILTDIELSMVDAIADGRTFENEKVSRQDRTAYEPGRIMDDNYLANRFATRAEFGVAKLYGAKWLARVWEVKDASKFDNECDCLLGDTNIEVRWRRTGNRVPVTSRDMRVDPKPLVVWAEVHAPHPGTNRPMEVVVVGEAWAQDLWAVGEFGSASWETKFADPKYLHPAGTLVEFAS